MLFYSFCLCFSFCFHLIWIDHHTHIAHESDSLRVACLLNSFRYSIHPCPALQSQCFPPDYVSEDDLLVRSRFPHSQNRHNFVLGAQGKVSVSLAHLQTLALVAYASVKHTCLKFTGGCLNWLKQDKNADLSMKIEQGFGPNGLGILSVTDVWNKFCSWIFYFFFSYLLVHFVALAQMSIPDHILVFQCSVWLTNNWYWNLSGISIAIPEFDISWQLLSLCVNLWKNIGRLIGHLRPRLVLLFNSCAFKAK